MWGLHFGVFVIPTAIICCLALAHLYRQWPDVLVTVFENGWGPDELAAKLGHMLDLNGQENGLEGQLVDILAAEIQAVHAALPAQAIKGHVNAVLAPSIRASRAISIGVWSRVVVVAVRRLLEWIA